MLVLLNIPNFGRCNNKKIFSTEDVKFSDGYVKQRIYILITKLDFGRRLFSR